MFLITLLKSIAKNVQNISRIYDSVSQYSIDARLYETMVIQFYRSIVGMTLNVSKCPKTFILNVCAIKKE